ncbi:class I ribonucleotide reductase maintenance protein YfaE [Shewanella psychrotolerans]|uniref:class I ribonucleotide reductase maintenance protein YfaE n=1 Tax=Shewanella psychrotolerans TaxID=2864206 RepID=UPI001C65852E|nr:class I ribonucleotide reductase maintenance protein YfaE [Shewanella psychrotolerans]QYJ99793.1 2Fe-2S iron-sulfur cluster binding domain-containing protein [Shewanella psychrotolerans]
MSANKTDLNKLILKKAPIVSLQGQPVLLYTLQHQSLLEALEQKKVKIFSECRNGFCGACKTKMIRGAVSYHTEPLVELEADECLPCCCHPDGDLDLLLSPQGVDVVIMRQSKQERNQSQDHKQAQQPNRRLKYATNEA